jgi:hypothetical protein
MRVSTAGISKCCGAETAPGRSVRFESLHIDLHQDWWTRTLNRTSRRPAFARVPAPWLTGPYGGTPPMAPGYWWKKRTRAEIVVMHGPDAVLPFQRSREKNTGSGTVAILRSCNHGFFTRAVPRATDGV